MKRTPLKRGTSQLRRTPLSRGFSQLKRTAFKKKPPIPGGFGTKRSKLRVRHHSETNDIKDDIQSLLREIVILRDEGCIFRFFPEAGACGGRIKKGDRSGELILQFDHLNSRSHAISFADHRLGICVCRHHHINFKKMEPVLYMFLVRKNIGPERSDLLDRVITDRRAYKMDWKLEKAALEQELRRLKELKNNN